MGGKELIKDGIPVLIDNTNAAKLADIMGEDIRSSPNNTDKLENSGIK